jgi:DNA-binding response OmpR family regulator
VRHDDLVAFLKRRSLAVPAALGGARSVLLVGFDERTARSLARHAPELAIHLAADLLDGMLKLGAHQPDALVLDDDRAGSADASVIGRIRAEPATASVLVVVVGSFGTKQERVSLFHQAGAAACLPKPLQLDALIRTLSLASQGR